MLAVMKTPVIIVSLLVLCQGCCTHSHCRRELFECKMSSAVDALSTLQYVDKGTPEQLHTDALLGLAASLEELQNVRDTAEKGELERLTRVILKHAEAYKAELSEYHGSLEMLDALSKLATEPASIRRVSELREYVATQRKHLPILER
jgi:hypothetical protein